jgi:hypothetical protein
MSPQLAEIFRMLGGGAGITPLHAIRRDQIIGLGTWRASSCLWMPALLFPRPLARRYQPTAFNDLI